MKKTKADFVFKCFSNDLVKRRNILKIKIQKKFLDFSHIHMEVDAYSKKNLEKVGKFNQNNFYQDDFDFWLKINKLQILR